MKICEIIRGRVAIQKMADREGKSYAEIEAAIQEALDFAWTEPTAREYQDAMFPDGKPSVAEFVGRIAYLTKDKMLTDKSKMPV